MKDPSVETAVNSVSKNEESDDALYILKDKSKESIVDVGNDEKLSFF